ncbi:hypothetical protein [Kitasatospora sp. GP82]|uniref:hypothetical protein n=1 Tax=Kitasatospora sp. GP82 TaxID=3035089 RepID=UPI002475F869|nr:hypothetical protein [Kitasatospora sp. GP82]MDH6125920.1 hypothetical protein [Kitasatospora sp. GP82]
MTILPDRTDIGVATAIAGDPLLVSALSGGDATTVIGPIARAATLLADLQADTRRYQDVEAAAWPLAHAENITDAIEDLLTNPATTRAVRQLIGQIVLTADQYAARWSK